MEPENHTPAEPEAPVPATVTLWDYLEANLPPELQPEFFIGDTEAGKGLFVLGPTEVSKTDVVMFWWNQDTEERIAERVKEIREGAHRTTVEKVLEGLHAIDDTIAKVEESERTVPTGINWRALIEEQTGVTMRDVESYLRGRLR